MNCCTPKALYNHVRGLSSTCHGPAGVPGLATRCLCVLSTWLVESKVHTVLEWVKPLPGCPPSQLFVLEGLRSDVIQWGHCSKLACHPGVNLTSFLIKQRFWWHSMGCGVQDLVFACSVFAHGKTSNQPPDGLVQPLSVPSRPWSHIALDFVTALPGQYSCFYYSGPVLEGGPLPRLA